MFFFRVAIVAKASVLSSNVEQYRLNINKTFSRATISFSSLAMEGSPACAVVGCGVGRPLVPKVSYCSDDAITLTQS